MSYIKQSLMNVMEGKFDPFVDIMAIHESHAEMFRAHDAELTAHNASHGMHPDSSCIFCREKEEMPEEVEMEVQDA